MKNYPNYRKEYEGKAVYCFTKEQFKKVAEIIGDPYDVSTRFGKYPDICINLMSGRFGSKKLYESGQMVPEVTEVISFDEFMKIFQPKIVESYEIF